MERHDETKPPIGAGSFEAWMRQGLKELRGALYPESNVAQPTEHGMYGTVTPGEVRDQRREEARGVEEDKGSILADREQLAEARAREEMDRDDRNRDSRGMDKE